jgi:MFS transporter, OPA family, sugar phosphate sensor protein UhpC
MFSYFKTQPTQPTLSDPSAVDLLYKRYRRSTFLSIFIGYSFFYTTRLSMSVGKEAIISSKILNAQQLGLIGSGFFFAYAIGKLTHGFLSDRVHIGRMMSCGLFLSALCNLAFGFTETFAVLLLIWTLNGWFQSTGSAPSGTNISYWFSQRERGWKYSIWSMAQNIGEVISFLLATYIIIYYSWQAAFWVPALLCIGVALVIHFTIKDRPISYGLPPIALYKDDIEAQKQNDENTSFKKQLYLLQYQWLWVLGGACACMYICRYAMTNWLVLYLQQAKGYTLIDASFCLSAFSLAGIAGTLVAGPISDTFFQAQRGPAAFYYALALCLSFLGLFWGPSAHYNDFLFAMIAGFSIGGLLVFLGGLIAIDLSPSHATGAALGFIGCFSYFGAAFQEMVSGYLIHKSTGMATHFTGVINFWIFASICTLLLVLLLWKRYRI